MFDWYKGKVDQRRSRLHYLHLYDPRNDLAIGDGEPIRDLASLWDVKVGSLLFECGPPHNGFHDNREYSPIGTVDAAAVGGLLVGAFDGSEYCASGRVQITRGPLGPLLFSRRAQWPYRLPVSRPRFQLSADRSGS